MSSGLFHTVLKQRTKLTRLNMITVISICKIPKDTNLKQQTTRDVAHLYICICIYIYNIYIHIERESKFENSYL
jgi:hypothetical protein